MDKIECFKDLIKRGYRIRDALVECMISGRQCRRLYDMVWG